VNRAEQVADLLREIVERGKTSGRPGADNDLCDVLDAALDPYALARVYAVASTHLGRLHGARARQDAISAGHLRPEKERPPADLGDARPLGEVSTTNGAQQCPD
jgi:hypothetical protein